MTRIGLLGDTHGSIGWVRYALNKFHREGIDTILQLGDFGIYDSTNGQHFLKIVRQLLEHYGQTLYVVPGNHEDWEYINSIPIEDDGWQKLRSNIFLAPRGFRWEWEGVSFVALGGGPSVDRSWRSRSQAHAKKRFLWWEEEAITDEDVAKTVEGGYADIMVAHDAPYVPSIDARIEGNPHGFEPADLMYAAEGRARMNTAFEGVKPKIFLHGHYHFLVNEIVGESHVLGLNCDEGNYSLGQLDLAKKTATAWDIKRDAHEWLAGPKKDI
jgi:hypothetical protein